MKHIVWTIIVFILFSSYSLAQTNALNSQTLKELQFRDIGPATMSGRIVDLAVVEKDPFVFYLASATGGVWKTNNNGVTFHPVFENEGTHSVGDIAVNQLDTSIVWVGTGERANRQSSSWGDGIYRSTDGGETWKNMGLKESHHIGRIVLHPSDTNVIYVAAMGHLWGPNEERGLYKSTNGGEDWNRIMHIDENTGFVDVAMDPSDPDILYAASYQRRRRAFGFDGGGQGSALYKSTDAGQNWEELQEGLPDGDWGRIGISIYNNDPNIIYVCVEQGFQYNASTAYGKRRAGVYRSEDKGETWKFMSDWNPRPMYASQILVDPSDDQRIYMQNSFSFSDDGGKTFRRARQSLHGDDRFLWVNPNDSRHVMKADDGGLGISYDRAQTWLYVTSLPLSQFYRVSVDMRDPYWIYGGLQDNGSWMGPSATYRSEGIRNQDWIKTGGGDGFLNLINPLNEDELYTESQYLGLSILNIKTKQRKSIRPGDPTGRIGPRRNWNSWGPGIDDPLLGNAMAPANWDGPFVISSHDAHVIYAGTNKLWKSLDGGHSWKDMGDLTSGVDRRELSIMGQRADSLTLSLDDGIPYYPTLSTIAESPVTAEVLFVGTDDGVLRMSNSGGKTWEELTSRLPGCPVDAWISGIEPSRFTSSRAYVAVNNYRNNDFANYLYSTEDGGKTWQSIVSDLPENRVLRTVREDPKNPNLLYLGTELGLFISIDRGAHWVELKNNMPTLPFNDLVIHPRDNDLILGSHGRGIWILDNLNPLQELSPAVLQKDFHLFAAENARMIRYSREGGHVGDMIYFGKNPKSGAMIDYYLSKPVSSKNASISIYGPDGELIRKIKVDTSAGIHRVYWNMRYKNLPGLPRNPQQSGDNNQRRFNRGAPNGPLVSPGIYTIRMRIDEISEEQKVVIEDDPRVDIDLEDRNAWTASQLEIGEVYSQIVSVLKETQPIMWAAQKLKKDKKELDESHLNEILEVNRLYSELLSRSRTLYNQVGQWMGRLTSDQESQLSYYKEMLDHLETVRSKLTGEVLPAINKNLDEDDRIMLK